jgi:hypothetical protein
VTTRERALTVLLGLAGIIAAGAIALAANAISDREIGLSAEPVSLAAKTPPPKPALAANDERLDDRDDSELTGDDVSGDGPGLASDDSGPSVSSGSGSEGGDDRVNSGPRSESGSSGPGTGTSTTPGPTTTSNSGASGGGDDRSGSGSDDSGGGSGPG